MPPPFDTDLAKELSEITTSLEAMYGNGEYCFENNECFDLEGFETIMDISRNEDELLRAWSGWHEVGKPMKPLYLRMVEIGNKGSIDLGYDGLDDLWFSKYDMPKEEFLSEIDRVLDEVKPLYEALHCHVRDSLNKEYGDGIVSKTGPLPAHILLSLIHI